MKTNKERKMDFPIVDWQWLRKEMKMNKIPALFIWATTILVVLVLIFLLSPVLLDLMCWTISKYVQPIC